MKKLILLLSFAFTLNVSYSQNGPPWKPTGNTASAGDFLGTTNNFPLLFYTNNTQQMSLGINGDLNLTSLNGIGNRILLTDANGNITALPQGNAGQYLLSDGTWSDLPLTVTLWKSIGNDITFLGGNLGIGTTSPSYKLDVLGDARISSNLYVGGGIVVTDKLDASIEVKAGDVKVNNDLTVNGNSKISGVLTSSQGLMFDATNNLGMKLITGSTPNTGTFMYGKQAPNFNPVPCAAAPAAGYNHAFGGVLQIFDVDGSGNYKPGSGLLNFQTWAGGSSIDASTGGSVTASGLLLNYFCGNSTFINTGPNGGSVYTGDQLYARKNLQIGASFQAINPNVSLNVFLDGTTEGVKIWSNNNSDKLINSNNGQFIVYGDGKTEINIQNPLLTTKAFYVFDKANNKDIFLVKSDGRVFAREVEISLATNFPDYVFQKDYKLLSLKDMESFINANEHLPGFEKGEHYEKNGINVNEMLIKQQEKIEEYALYLIEMKKEIADLKKQLDNYKK